MSCKEHKNHTHEHNDTCGHTKIQHNDHVDYVHDGHLHHKHGNHWDECAIEVSEKNPEGCTPVESDCNHTEECKHEKVPHGDHVDYLVDGHLHHVHGDHTDDHGSVTVIK